MVPRDDMYEKDPWAVQGKALKKNKGKGKSTSNTQFITVEKIVDVQATKPLTCEVSMYTAEEGHDCANKSLWQGSANRLPH